MVQGAISLKIAAPCGHRGHRLSSMTDYISIRPKFAVSILLSELQQVDQYVVSAGPLWARQRRYPVHLARPSLAPARALSPALTLQTGGLKRSHGVRWDLVNRRWVRVKIGKSSD